jgi:hypothetical protein
MLRKDSVRLTVVVEKCVVVRPANEDVMMDNESDNYSRRASNVLNTRKSSPMSPEPEDRMNDHLI